MDTVRQLIAKTGRALRRYQPGQDMAEYVLILAAVAIAGYTAYVALAGGIQGLINNVTAILSAA